MADDPLALWRIRIGDATIAYWKATRRQTRMIAMHRVRLGRYELNVFIGGTRGSVPWHGHKDHDGWSWIVRGGYVEESVAEGTPFGMRNGAIVPAAAAKKRTSVRAPCVRWIENNHRIRGDWASLFVHVQENRYHGVGRPARRGRRAFAVAPY